MGSLYNVVLSGGGVRGYAHIGCLQALIEKGLTINAISATSAGALVGAFVCDGFAPEELKELILKEEPRISINLTGFRNGVLSIDSLKKFVTKYLRSKNLEQLRTPLYVTTTNLETGNPVVFNEGPILPVLIAAAAIPALFAPVILNGVAHADGGISSNLPVEPFLNQPHKILGIHVNPLGAYDAKASITHLIDRSVHMALRSGIKTNIARCAIFIEPPTLSGFHLFENKKNRQIIEAGYNYVKQHVELDH